MKIGTCIVHEHKDVHEHKVPIYIIYSTNKTQYILFPCTFCVYDFVNVHFRDKSTMNKIIQLNSN